jgi:exodeoxyribonuclease VII small subunit
MAAKKKATFEEELAQVEAVLERMEAGGQPIEEALKDYGAGLKLIAGMEKELAGMKQRMTVLGGENIPEEET